MLCLIIEQGLGQLMFTMQLKSKTNIHISYFKVLALMSPLQFLLPKRLKYIVLKTFICFDITVSVAGAGV